MNIIFLKKILILTLFFSSIFFNGALQINVYATITQQDMLVGTTDGGGGGDLDVGGGNSVSLKDNFLKTIMDYILKIVVLVVIAMFLYIGFELATAEGKQEKLTKGLKSLVYVGIGLAVIPLAYIIVKVATGFSF